MTVEPIKEGEYVYLVPTLPTAPSAAYRMPLCEVVRVSGYRITVDVDGDRIETDERNIKRKRPDLSPRDPRPQKRPSMPDGYAEVTLW
ncbi:hypothetical protein [Micromonospora sp. DH14]|uniref:hypothetical protein n=1 Tax=Micromonospora sp. DH14 TaxID=3040120 RepID=UPI00244276EE|nr:hypothetical protein [Micromonospora sp. DH14]MDG9679038.1 hypothetical protein [Micromonospora sp. DH14]